MFLDRLIALVPETWFGSNRRRHRRHNRVTYIELQPLDNDLTIAGPMVWGMTRDVSRRGIGLTTSFSLNCDYVHVNIRDDDFSGVGVIRHQSLVGDGSQNRQFVIGIELMDDSELHYK